MGGEAVGSGNDVVGGGGGGGGGGSGCIIGEWDGNDSGGCNSQGGRY